MSHPGYYVWNPARSYGHVRHETLSKATTEAKRLAAANPGSSFFIMAPVAVAHTEKPQVIFELVDQNKPVEFDLEDEIPF